jgi:hypothetical protein
VVKLHLPPKFNLRGRRQVWFIETGTEGVDDIINGVLTSLMLLVAIAGGVYLGGGI